MASLADICIIVIIRMLSTERRGDAVVMASDFQFIGQRF